MEQNELLYWLVNSMHTQVLQGVQDLEVFDHLTFLECTFKHSVQDRCCSFNGCLNAGCHHNVVHSINFVSLGKQFKTLLVEHLIFPKLFCTLAIPSHATLK